ncbi:MAG: T9SS type A sorting domain-containing protein [Flavobacteriia bacterium]|jgi:hypothetical protein
MKRLLLSAAVLAGVTSANAQFTAGSIAPDFTVTAYQPWLSGAGMNSNGTYQLYDYLDAGYTVIFDVSATWCGPCWSYHTGGALEDLYAAHGPAGYPGVSATTTDDVMVIWVEGDDATADATMLNGAGATIGNWITPTAGNDIQFPMANPAAATANQIMSDYNIGGYPTILKICPNRVVEEVGQASATQLYAAVGDCPAPASLPTDGALLQYLGETSSCGVADLVVRLQNNGTSPLTSCTITATEGATTVATLNWTGNLPTYGYQDVTIGTFTPTTASHNISIQITSADGSAANNTVATTIGLAGTGNSSNVVVKVTLDAYGSETSWKIKRSNGTTAYSSPAYTNAASSPATVPQPDINTTLPDDCYSLEVLDSYGDGFDSGYGNGLVQVWVNGVQIAGVSNFPTGSAASSAFLIDAVAGIEEFGAANFTVYPNPASDVLNVSFEALSADYEVAILDLQGRTVSSKSLQSLNGAQTIEFPVSDLAKGSYIVTVTTNGLTKTQNVVIK